MKDMRKTAGHHRGYTMIEMLVSVLIFSFVVVVIYFLFDRGKWLYLHSESRTTMQDNARLGLEFMEREVRMASVGVPTGTNIDPANPEQVWLPDVFLAGRSQIGFRGDVDNNNSMMTADAANNASVLNVLDPTAVCPATDPNILIVRRGRSWQGTACTSTGSGIINIAPNTLSGFTASECEIYTPEHVWYRLTPDADANGVCDLDTGSSQDDYNSCLLQRCMMRTNAPTTDTTNCSWETVSTYVRSLTFEYFEAGSTGPVAYTSVPLIGDDLFRVDKIKISLGARGRSDQTGVFQDLNFATEILIRKRVL